MFGHPPTVFPYFGHRSAHRLTITARALRAREPAWHHTGDLAKMRALWQQFASREEPHLPVTLVVGTPDGAEQRHEVRADDEGYAHFSIDLNGWERPAHTAWETVRFEWMNRTGPQSTEGFVLAPGHATRMGVISDIDDTVIETGITGGPRALVRNWRRMLATMPDDRTPVPGAGQLYGRLAGSVLAQPDKEPGTRLIAPHRPFFYVSSSPWNLFGYLVAFMRSRSLPLGPLHLRDWDFNRATLGSSGHGAHKRLAAEGILATYPDMKFALIGDDTQGDLVAYSHLAADFPGRIAAIFIRHAGELHTAEELAAITRIEAAGVPFWHGESFEVGTEFLEQIGVSQTGDTAQIVDTIEKDADAKPEKTLKKSAANA
ncbi:phosphatase domain-containing protein [Croceicoccus naphthovorans]|uniref:phosphatase domain-containing protein n=1 Tax=Croceicoccus naphthovorans TaxID=1348774 RepID=UPI0017E1DB92|nr:phosphatidate phosphatase APP1 [Croceicoccus naphthovorans]